MRYAFLLLCLVLLLPACNSYEKENNRLKEENKMLREENEYTKAEIIGLKKELAELGTKVKDEREALEKKAEEERGLMQKKLEEEREAMRKKAESDKKKSGPVKKEQVKNDAAKKPLPRSGAVAVKKDRPPKDAGSVGNKTKETATKPGAQKAHGSNTPAGGSPGEE